MPPQRFGVAQDRKSVAGISCLRQECLKDIGLKGITAAGFG